jgi:hypothetical protein
MRLLKAASVVLLLVVRPQNLLQRDNFSLTFDEPDFELFSLLDGGWLRQQRVEDWDESAGDFVWLSANSSCAISKTFSTSLPPALTFTLPTAVSTPALQ